MTKLGAIPSDRMLDESDMVERVAAATVYRDGPWPKRVAQPTFKSGQVGGLGAFSGYHTIAGGVPFCIGFGQGASLWGTTSWAFLYQNLAYNHQVCHNATVLGTIPPGTTAAGVSFDCDWFFGVGTADGSDWWAGFLLIVEDGQ